MTTSFRLNEQQPAGFRLEPRSLFWTGWANKGLVALGVFAGIALAVVLGALLPRVYQSSAQIAVLKKRPDAVTGVDTRQLAAEDYLAPPPEILKSSAIISGAIRSKGLEFLPAAEQEGTNLTEHIRSGLAVTAGKAAPGQNVVYKVTYRGPDTEGCRAVLAAILQ